MSTKKVLIDAARRGDVKQLSALVRAGADLNSPYRGYRPLHALIQETPDLTCLKWLLAHGADPQQLGAWPPARALLIAAFSGQRACVEVLIEAGAVQDGFSAAALGEVAAVKRRLARDAGFANARDAGGLTALQCAAASRVAAEPRLLKMARLLLDCGADPNARTRSWDRDVDAAHFAAAADHGGIFELLLARGADASAALVPALWNRRYEMAEAALRHGAQPDRAVDGGKPLLNNLVRWGRIAPALWLLARGASPNLCDDRGWTAVRQAASRGNKRLWKAVLDAGGDPAASRAGSPARRRP